MDEKYMKKLLLLLICSTSLVASQRFDDSLKLLPTDFLTIVDAFPEVPLTRQEYEQLEDSVFVADASAE